jgi:DNA modification methylase
MHSSDNAVPLGVRYIKEDICRTKTNSRNVEFVVLPYFKNIENIPDRSNFYETLNEFLSRTDAKSTIAILTSPICAVDFCAQLRHDVHLKLWIAIKFENSIEHPAYLSDHHAALLILTRYKESLRHTKTRIGYSYCPFCDRTTKDYGGKKHLYHEFGTLMSDVWRDITVNYESSLSEIVNRLKDLFGIPDYDYVNIYDQRKYYIPVNAHRKFLNANKQERAYPGNSILLNEDCIAGLKSIPDNSIDFCFADPPYNLGKKYESADDGIEMLKYFEWCDQWLSELGRILKHGRTLAVLNIPQWCIRHFKHLNTILNFQDWIVWEGLSLPVRMIMPAHYSILCFTKGKPRPLPGIVRENNSILERKAIQSIAENYCLRSNCVSQRRKANIQDSQIVTNLWWDIHRLKHNSRRVDHPCQLPPMFMYRLISLFTNENEFVLDPFNGVGTTTLTAQQLNRKFVGIELSEYYHNIALSRHREIENGVDPFRKNYDTTAKAKNSRVGRLKKQKYKVSKKILQLEVKNIAHQIGRIPTKEDVTNFSKFPIEYFENYFIDWGEVTAAARTTGMTEYKNKGHKIYQNEEIQLRLFEKSKKKYPKKAISKKM